MTTDVFDGPIAFTINASAETGKPITFPYSQTSDVAIIVLTDDDQRIVLDPATDFTVTPDGPANSGTVALTSAIVNLYQGETMLITRDTRTEQGFEGVGGAREKGLERELDRLARSVQDRRYELRSSLRADRELDPFVPVPGRLLGFDGDGKPAMFAGGDGGAGLQVSAFWEDLLLASGPTAILQALSPNLVQLSGLSLTANKVVYAPLNNTLGTADFTGTARGLIERNSKSDMRAYLELGSAAQQSVGLGAGNVPQLQAGGKLPAVDGSNLTELLRGFEFVETLHSFVDDGGLNQVETPALDDTFEYLMNVVGVSHNQGGNNSLILGVEMNGNWSNPLVVISNWPAGDRLHAIVTAPLQFRTARTQFFEIGHSLEDGSDVNLGQNEIATFSEASPFTAAIPAKVTRWRVVLGSGLTSGGNVNLYRRRIT